MRHFRFSYCAITLSSLGAALASAQTFSPVDQSRYTATSAFIGSSETGDMFDDDSDSAADYGPFVSTIFSSLSTTPPVAGVNANADQSSVLGATLITATASTSASAGTRPGSFLQAVGETGFSYTFSLDQAVEVLIDGFVSESDDNLALATVGLFDMDSNTLVSFDATGDLTPFSVSQLLSPGEYRLEALASTTVQDGTSGAASFSVNLAVPEPSGALMLLAGIAFFRRGAR